MAKLKGIIDRERLFAEIDAATVAPAPAPEADHKVNERVLDLLGTAYAQGRARIDAQFEHTHRPAAYLKTHSALMDVVIQGAVSAVSNAQAADAALPPVSCVAVGGYGRRELFPASDIDLLFVYESRALAPVKAWVEGVLYYLWDVGLTVGHAVRTVPETLRLAARDHTITANLLDRRFICGSRALFQRLDEQIRSRIIGAEPALFIEAKQEESIARHRRQGDSRFFLEPNIKENKGGLRDLHSLHWLAAYVYGVRTVSALVRLEILSQREYREFYRAQQFLWCVRIYLHLLSGRAEERLSFDMQLRISQRLGYRASSAHKPVERFMTRYFQVAKSVGELTRLFSALLEDAYRRRSLLRIGQWFTRSPAFEDFVVQGGRLQFAEAVDLSARPILLLQLFHTAQHAGLAIHPRAWQRVRRHHRLIDQALRTDAQANRLFLDMLLADTQPDITLRWLNETGVLGRFIPEFGKIVGQMQYDMYHVFTVDEHTLRAIGTFHAIERGRLANELPLATRIIHRISSRRALLVALLCHDIGKGSGGRHAEKGEKIVRRLGQRFGLNQAEADMAGWLVREHALPSDVAFKRDLSDPRTIADFVARVQSPERLRVLLIITVCDIRAVGPAIWNGWKGALLRELYHRAEEQMGLREVDSRSQAIDRFRRHMQDALSGWDEADRARYFAVGFPALWLAAPYQPHIRLAHLLRRCWRKEQAIAYDYEVDSFLAVTRLILCLPEHHRLMPYIAGSLATVSASIAAAKLFTLRDGLAVALLDIQSLQGGAFDDEPRLHKCIQTLQSSLAGTFDLAHAVAEQQRAYESQAMAAMHTPPDVFIDNHSSDSYTLIEVNGQDRIGFLYELTTALSERHLTIATSHITTYGERAVDVFYVKDGFGLKITHPTKLAQIRDAVLACLGYRVSQKE